MNQKKILLFLVMSCLAVFTKAQVEVYVNTNMVHSVDGVSDFGRDRHLVVHSAPWENDWVGEEDKMDYFINELDVYFGRDNGSASWDFDETKVDPNNSYWPDLEWMNTIKGPAQKNAYTYEDRLMRSKQFEDKGHMIMGSNPHALYPTLAWHGHWGTFTGWRTVTTEASAAWVGEYFDSYFSKGEGDIGKKLPEYWEVVNEIDMVLMSGAQVWSSWESVWRYHNQVADAINEKLGDNKVKIGGMTWGQHDIHRGDLGGWSANRHKLTEPANPAYFSSKFPEMWQTKFEYNNYFTNDWYQWDVLWQGFMEACGDRMDFHSIHLYDWPEWKFETNPTIRSGGHVEGLLDIVEWYDITYGNTKAKKEVVISEYGAVGPYIDQFPNADPARRDWENIKPFNSMLMQFLERPSQVRLTSQFTPIKATWGDYLDANGKVTARYPYTMLDDNDGDGQWEWSEFIKFYELWSDVDGTRVETKSTDKDIQVDAYVNGKHMYLILNNMQEATSSIDLSLYGNSNGTIESVNIKELWLDTSIGEGKPTLSRYSAKTVPGKIELKPDATIILDIVYASNIVLDQTCKEFKVMGERIGTGTTEAGGPKFTVDYKNMPTQAMKINNVPALSGSDEAVLRITGAFRYQQLESVVIKLNGKTLEHNNNWRGEAKAGHGIGLKTLEVDVPLDYLNASGNNDISVYYGSEAGFAVCQLQYWKHSSAPGRGKDNVAVSNISLPSTFTITQGEEKGLTATIAPANASDKSITWTSSAPAVVSVNEYGVIKSLKAGSATITAKAGTKSAACNVTSKAFTAVPVTGISIQEGNSIVIEQRKFTRLNALVAPANASAQTVVWSSADESIVKVNPENGMLDGLAIGKSTTITAKVIDTYTGSKVYSANINVTVGIPGEEYVSCLGINSKYKGNTTFNFIVSANVAQARNVVVELRSGSTVLGTATKEVSTIGLSKVDVSIDVASVPAPGTYTLRAYLKDGSTTLDQHDQAFEMELPIQPTSLTFKEWLWEVEVNKSLQIQATVLPVDAFNKTINWTSSNNAIASVDANGLVTGHAVGNVTITGKTQDAGITQKVDLKVVNTIDVKATAISILPLVNVLPGATTELAIVWEPEWTTDRNITWSITDGTVLKNTSGNTFTVTGAEGSKTAIKGVYNANSALTLNTTVKVGGSIHIEAESFENQGGHGDIMSSTIIENVQTGDWVTYPVYIPETGKYKFSFKVASGDDNGLIGIYANGANVGSGKPANKGWTNFQTVVIDDVQLTKGGQTLLIKAAGSGAWQWNMDYFDIELSGPTAVTSVEVTPEAWTMLVNDSKTLAVNVAPGNATNKTINWSSDNTSVATVDAATGKVIAKGLGTAKITATSEDGGISDFCTVKVVSSILVEELTVTPEKIHISSGKTLQLSTVVSPVNAENKTITYKSLNTSIATVNANGLVTSVANGTTTITVSTNDGSNIVKNIPVTIENISVTAINITPNPVVLLANSTKQLTAEVIPANANITAVTWKSSDATVAAVDANGIVTAKSVGTATITASSKDGSNISSNVEVTVTSIITIEAEDLINDDGNFSDGQPNGGTGVGVATGIGINYVNAGDWAEYTLEIPNSGEYQITYYIAAPGGASADDPNITLYINSELESNDAVAITSNWEDYQALVAKSTVKLAEGSYTIKLEASGSDWQWNLDKIELVKVGPYVPTNIEFNAANSTSVYPNPTNSELWIDTNEFEKVDVKIFNATGSLVKIVRNQSVKTPIQVSDLPSGMYILYITDFDSYQTIKFSKSE